MTRADLELWMLPLFLPRYRRWRLARGLSAFPSAAAGCNSLPPAPPALFGVSPAVLPRPGYWPAKAEVCGFWSFTELSPRYQPPDRLVRFLEECEESQKAVFCVGLGSMPALGLVKNSRGIVFTAVSSLKTSGVAVILLPTAADDEPPCEACHDTDLLDLKGEEVFVPHDWLFSRCRGVVHHGGSGTTGAAMRGGAVQVVVPFAFDQFFFADQVQHIGVGARVSGTLPQSVGGRGEGGLLPSKAGGSGVTRGDFDAAVAAVLSPGVRESARRYGDLLRREDGMRAACSAIASAICTQTATGNNED